MDGRFLLAFTDPAPVKIAGRMVPPFSLLSRMRLCAGNSPLLKGGADLRPVDLLIAVKLCTGEPIILTWRDKLELWKMRKPKYFLEQVELFGAYVLVGHWPKFWESKDNGSASGIPWILSTVSVLIANGFSEQRAWTMPECQAMWYSVAFSVNKGSQVKLLTTQEEEFLDSLSKDGE